MSVWNSFIDEQSDVKKTWYPTKVAVMGLFSMLVIPGDGGNAWALYFQDRDGRFHAPLGPLVHVADTEDGMEILTW
jgi:hypothetical protein